MESPFGNKQQQTRLIGMYIQIYWLYVAIIGLDDKWR